MPSSPAPAVSALLRAVLFAAASAALLANTATSASASGARDYLGFAYSMPNGDWRSRTYASNDKGGLVTFERSEGARSVMIQVSDFQPIRAVRSQAEIVRWARGAAGARSAQPAKGHGATCARYRHRFNQTLSLGGPAQPWAELDDHGLQCILPGSDRVVQFRFFERAPLGQLTGTAGRQADALFRTVRFSR